VKGIIVVFDVTSDDSYFNVQHWIKTVKQFAGTENVKFVFVGNKNDMSEWGRKVSQESGEHLARQHNGVYIDASAKTKHNIDQIFKKMAESILNVELDMHSTSTRESEVDDLSQSNGGVGEGGGNEGRGGGGFRCTVL